jgi:16S rRNA (guanine527-N7)-methyltransferase
VPIAREELAVTPVDRLVQDAASAGAALSAEDAARLLTLLDELHSWNQRFNLTGIKTRDAMVTHHLLDSLAVQGDLYGERIADVGTGAGFPGLPLAVCNPQRHFTLIDSTTKKIRFVEHMVRHLGLSNVEVLNARAETLKPERPYDSVVARALAPLPELVRVVKPLTGPRTHVLAMKGKWPQEELAQLKPPWHVLSSRPITVPGLDAARCVIVLGRG